MAFDPDKYLASTPAPAAPPKFDPDAYLASKEGIPGMRRVRPGEIPTESGYVAAPPAEPERSVVQKILSYGIETPLVIGSRLLGAPLYMGAVPTGFAYGTATGKGGEAGIVGGMQAVEQQMYQPRTPEGEQVLDAFGRVMSVLPVKIGTGSIPQVAVSPAARTVGTAGRAAVADLEAAARAQENRAFGAKVKQSYELGPKIDAAAQGRELGLVVPPTTVAPTKGARVGTTLAGTARVIETANKANEPVWNAAAREDLNLPTGTKLDSSAFVKARNAPEVKGPYDEVSRLGTLTDPNLNVAAKLENLKSGALLGDEGAAAKVNEWVGKLQDQIAEGVDASVLTASIRQMRDEASQLFKSGKAGAKITPEETAMAQAKFGAASALEDLLAQNIQDKTLLDRFKKAREFNARSYDYERSTNLATGQVDPSALAALVAEGKPVSGNLAKMANFAANFPEVSQPGAGISKPGVLDVVKRGGVGGVVGSALGGAMFGLPGYWGGGLLGTATGGALSELIARRQAGPAAQAAIAAAPDYRLIVNQLTPAAMTPRNVPNQLAVYDWARATSPDWVPGGRGPLPTFGPEPAPGVPLLGVSSAEDVMAGVQRMRAQDYASAKMREEAAMRAAEQQGQTPYGQMVNQLTATGERRRTEGVPLEFSVGSGKFYPAEGTPAGPIIGAPTALETAVQKMSGQVVPQTQTRFEREMIGSEWPSRAPMYEARPVETTTTFERGVPQLFNLTAQEKIAWNKAKADLVQLEPGFKTLSDKAIAEKMMDRQWVEATMQKARDKAAAFEALAAKAKDEQARRDALANRERMLDTLDSLEERLRVGRPVERGGQGPKTRAAQAERTNKLAPETETVNKLIVPESAGGGARQTPGPVNVSVGPSLESRRGPVEAPAAPKAAPTETVTHASPAAKEAAQSMQAAFNYAPDLAAKYANDAGWLTNKIVEAEKLLAFERMMEQQGAKPAEYAAKLPRMIEAMKARLKELK